MSKEQDKKREFYVFRVTREDNESPVKEEKKEEKYIISPHYGKQVDKTENERMGYHRDPSTYDFIRPNKGLNKEYYDRYREELNEKENNANLEEVVEDAHNDEALTPLQDAIIPDERGYYVEEEKEASIEDLPLDFFNESEIEKEESTTPYKDYQSPKTEERVVTMPKPRVSSNPSLEKLEEKRTPSVEIKAPKVSKYIPPKLEFLTTSNGTSQDDKKEAEHQKEVINNTLKDFNIKAEVVDYIFGPTVTQFMIKVAPGVNVNIINTCEDNLAMYLEVERIRIQTPIPGKPYAGIEVPKSEKYRNIVQLGDIIKSKEFKETKCKIPVVVGKDNYGLPMICDIGEMPHCLIAGTTKSGKSVCLNTFILSLLYHFTPRDMRLVLMDPKRIELTPYEDIPHLAMPVISDKEDFPSAITWVYEEMERRYRIFEMYNEKDFKEFNKRLVEDKKQKLPYIIVIIDEFGDWFTGIAADVEDMIQKIAAKARAAGIHVILATQRPSKDVIKGSIKANFDTRIAFKVSSFEDSRVILGKGGAETLEGYGDMLIKYAGKIEKRLQGAYVDNSDLKKVINFLKENNKCDYIVTKEEIHQSTTSRQMAQNIGPIKSSGLDDERFEEVAYYVVRNKNASNNALLREFGMGFNRVNDILMALEKLGVLGPTVKGKQREVLVDEYELESILNNL